MPNPVGAMPCSTGAMPNYMGAMLCSRCAMPSPVDAMPCSTGAMPNYMGAMPCSRCAMPNPWAQGPVARAHYPAPWAMPCFMDAICCRPKTSQGLTPPFRCCWSTNRPWLNASIIRTLEHMVCTSRAQENCTGLGIEVLKYHQGRNTGGCMDGCAADHSAGCGTPL